VTVAQVFPPFWSEGACAGVDPELFFPERGASTREAKTVCSTCPVRAECLGWALTNHEKFGIWGGTSERERRRIKRRMLIGQDTPELTVEWVPAGARIGLATPAPLPAAPKEERTVDLAIATPIPASPATPNGELGRVLGRPVDPATGKPTDVCVNCGTRYTPSRRDQRFHSKECARAWYSSHPKTTSGKREPRIGKRRAYKPRAAKTPVATSPVPAVAAAASPATTGSVDLQSLLGQLLAGCDHWHIEANLGDVHVSISRGSP